MISITIRCPEELAAELDKLREAQPFPPTRTTAILAAIRHLLEAPPYPFEPAERQAKRRRRR
jgi:metal-responsive CopG/Arc/MetJ family transcriptional regulator